MNTLVLYDSNYRNTKLIAKTIAQVLHTNAKSVKKFTDLKPDEYDLLVIGSPINGWRPTPTMMNYLKGLEPNSLQGKNGNST